MVYEIEYEKNAKYEMIRKTYEREKTIRNTYETEKLNAKNIRNKKYETVYESIRNKYEIIRNNTK